MCDSKLVANTNENASAASRSAAITSPKFGKQRQSPHATASAPARSSADGLAAVALSLLEYNTFDRSL